jgi:hypothetical protein
MEGIMNLPADVGGATSQDGLDSFAPLIAAQQAAQDMGYPRFTRELLSAGAEMDQAEVQEFLQTIRDAGLTSDDVSMMRRVVEAVFGDPNNYPEVRARLLAEGVPEDILPETFDLEFFVALRMAVEEAENLSQEPRPTGQDMPVQMAEGGIVGLPQMTPIAREMAAMGRNGDTMLAHITPQEAMMLQRMGGSGTINPYTGLPEFFIGKLFKGLVKGIKKFAKSTIGRIVISVALGAFLGPMATGFLSGMGVTVGAAAATGISAGIGVFGSSLLAGDGFKNSLRNGLTAGALSFGVAGVTQGFSAPAAGAPQTLGEGFTKGLDNITSPFRKAADFIRGGPDAAAQTASDSAIKTAQDYVTQPAINDPTAQLALGDSPYNSFGQGPPRLTGEEYFKASPYTSGLSSQEFNKNLITNQAVDPGSLDYSGQLAAERGTQIGYPGGSGPPVVPYAADAGSLPGISPSSITGPELGAPLNRIQPLSPANAPAVAPGAATSSAGPTMIDRAQSFYQDPSVKSFGNIFYDASAKTTLGKLAPGLTTAGIAYLASGDPFKAPLPEGMTQEEFDAKIAQDQAQFRQDRPAFYGSFTRPEYYLPPTYRAAEGSGPEGVENFPRKNGAINGPGTGTSDDIPAMLSDGEFVFTAKSVRNMGGGSRRKGAAKMYKLMKMLEGGPVSKTAGA